MTFKADNWGGSQIRRTLVQIDLTDPASHSDSNYRSGDPPYPRSLYICDAAGGPYVYGGNEYDPLLTDLEIKHSTGAYFDKMSDGECTLHLTSGKMAFQQKHAAAPAETNQWDVKFSQLLSDYSWLASTVTVTRIVLTGSGTETAQQDFKGIVYSVGGDIASVEIVCLQDKTKIKKLPDTTTPSASSPSIITRVKYANAPDDSIGRMIPAVYCNKAMLQNGAEALSTNPRFMTNIWPAIITDGLYDAANTRLAIVNPAKYPATTGSDPADDKCLYLWIPELSTWALCANASQVWTETTSGFSCELQENPKFWLYLNVADKQAATAGVTDAGKAFDGRATTSASIASSGSNEDLDLNILFPSALGRITESRAFVVLAAGTGVGANDATVNGVMGYWNSAIGNWHGNGTAHQMSVDLTKANLRDGGYLTSDYLDSTILKAGDWQAWRFHGRDSSGVQQDCYWRIRVSSNGATAKVVSAGVLVGFIPQNLRRESGLYGSFDIRGARVG